MVENIEDEDSVTYYSVEELFADLDRKDLEWEQNHPLRAYIRKQMDKIFPHGIADRRAYYAIQEPREIFRYIKYGIIHAWQRLFRGWDDTACWNVGYYLAEILPPIIRQLKEVGNGVPMSMYEGFEEVTLENGYIGFSDEADKIASERWDKILDEIADGFDSYIKFDEKHVRPEEYEKDEDYQKFQRALDLLKEHYQSLWD
jgi:hypothetical protein